MRVIAATNRDLEAEVEAGASAHDLYYRLNGVRDRSCRRCASGARRSPRWPSRFLASACARSTCVPAHLSDASLAALRSYAWPGNVRELRNAIERAALVAAGPSIEPSDLHLAPAPAPDLGAAGSTEKGLPTTRAHIATGDRERIEDALQRCGGNQSRAAKVLGIPRRTLVRRISKLGLTRPRKSATS